MENTLFNLKEIEQSIRASYYSKLNIQQLSDGWYLGRYDDWGLCDQSGDEVRGDQCCAIYEPHPGLTRRNGFDIY